MDQSGHVQHLYPVHPEGLPAHPAFTHAVLETGNMKTVSISGQNAIDGSGVIVGKGDLGTQVEQALKNLQIALAAAGAALAHIVS